MTYKSTYHDYEKECLAHMASNGIPFNGVLDIDGEIQRFSIDAKKNPDEWYVCFAGISMKNNPYLICIYGTWSGGEVHHIYRSYENNLALSSEELAQIKVEEHKRKVFIDQQLQVEKELSIQKAQEIWEESAENPTLPDHSSYLNRKKVNPYGLRYRVEYNGSAVIVIPLRNVEDRLCAIQRIFPNGDKRINGVKKGNFLLIGKIQACFLVYIVEGYATGVSIYQATGSPVVVAFDCGNLKPVAANLKKKYPQTRFVIAGDNDFETIGNPGKTKAEEAAKSIGCEVVLPSFPKDFKFPNGKCPTDFNDLHVCFGLEAVKNQLILKKPYLQALDISELLTKEFPPRKLILDPWLPEKGLTMIYAPRGVGKTFLSLSIAYAVACGGSFLRWKAEEPRKVLYIDGEMPATAMQERLTAITKTFGKTPPDPSYFRIVSHEFQAEGIHDIGSLQGQQDIMDLIDESEADLVILDNLSTLVRSGNENEADSWVQIQEWMLRLRKNGKAVLLIHHAGKSGAQRGTSKREDILDTVLSLKKPKDYSSNDGARFEVHVEKSRGFYGEAAEPFEASLITDAKGLLKWNCKKTDGRDLEVVVGLYKGGMTNQRELAEETGFSVGKTNNLIKEAKKEGLI